MAPAHGLTLVEVGYPEDPRSQVGPVIQVPGEKLERGLTRLGPGERWALQPQPLDETGRLWSPGIRSGVQPGSDAHLTEYFGPVLGVMTAATLEDAVDLVNAVDYGLTSGLLGIGDVLSGRWNPTVPTHRNAPIPRRRVGSHAIIGSATGAMASASNRRHQVRSASQRIRCPPESPS